jgi:hypothetical protein
MITTVKDESIPSQLDNYGEKAAQVIVSIHKAPTNREFEPDVLETLLELDSIELEQIVSYSGEYDPDEREIYYKKMLSAYDLIAYRMDPVNVALFLGKSFEQIVPIESENGNDTEGISMRMLLAYTRSYLTSVDNSPLDTSVCLFSPSIGLENLLSQSIESSKSGPNDHHSLEFIVSNFISLIGEFSMLAAEYPQMQAELKKLYQLFSQGKLITYAEAVCTRQYNVMNSCTIGLTSLNNWYLKLSAIDNKSREEETAESMAIRFPKWSERYFRPRR